LAELKNANKSVKIFVTPLNESAIGQEVLFSSNVTQDGGNMVNNHPIPIIE
jgi:hypothetical protein